MQVNNTEQALSGLGLGKQVGGQNLGKEEFLQLLVAQMQHQDPLEPMKNSDLVAQLAQFSSVEQLVSVNEGINILGMQQMGMANAQAAEFIGKEVEVRSDKLEVTASDMSKGAAFSLEGDAESVQVKLRDEKGDVVRTIELGAQGKGEVEFDWDLRDDNGTKVPPGTYRMEIVAEDADGNAVRADTKIRGVVDGVGYEAGYPELNIGSIKAAVADVLAVFPSSDEQT